jgi:hypothetical protein
MSFTYRNTNPKTETKLRNNLRIFFITYETPADVWTIISHLCYSEEQLADIPQSIPIILHRRLRKSGTVPPEAQRRECHLQTLH